MRLYVYIEVVIVFFPCYKRIGMDQQCNYARLAHHYCRCYASNPKQHTSSECLFLMGNSMLFGPATLFWGNCLYSESRSIQIGSHVMSTQKRSKKDQKGSLYRKEIMFQGFPGS